MDCWNCGGTGGFHDCGEDTCCCRDPQPNKTCEICHGTGALPDETEIDEMEEP